MTTREIHFFNIKDTDSSRTPYILDNTCIDYVCDGKEGYICFDGYYYVEDHAPPYPEDEGLEAWNRPSRYSEWLPKKVGMIVHLRETEPSKTEIQENGSTRMFYTMLEDNAYSIEIYKRVIHEKTDRMSEIEEDGEIMNVCFFPTNKQTLYFRVLDTLSKG